MCHTVTCFPPTSSVRLYIWWVSSFRKMRAPAAVSTAVYSPLVSALPAPSTWNAVQSGGSGGGGGGGFNSTSTDSESWDDGPKRDRRAQKKKKSREEESWARVPAPKKNRRESGRSWRDYTVEDDGDFEDDE